MRVPGQLHPPRIDHLPGLIGQRLSHALVMLARRRRLTAGIREQAPRASGRGRRRDDENGLFDGGGDVAAGGFEGFAGFGFARAVPVAVDHDPAFAEVVQHALVGRAGQGGGQARGGGAGADAGQQRAECAVKEICRGWTSWPAKRPLVQAWWCGRRHGPPRG